MSWSSTFIPRGPDIWDKVVQPSARPKLGGADRVSTARRRACKWTPTGNNVPDYPKLAQLWWQNIGRCVVPVRRTPQGGGWNSLAASPGLSVMERLEKSGVQGACGPKMNKKETAEVLVRESRAKEGNIAPQRKLANEKPEGRKPSTTTR